ncbi:MAG: hypothetical protein NZ585_03650 [Chloracidobacterium sp.]|nr:hypothetical protein [Chloracidobacterium sp.]MDW8217161.1 hypothetical protein [Acidobacteriota bacterium]
MAKAILLGKRLGRHVLDGYVTTARCTERHKPHNLPVRLKDFEQLGASRTNLCFVHLGGKRTHRAG